MVLSSDGDGTDPSPFSLCKAMNQSPNWFGILKEAELPFSNLHGTIIKIYLQNGGTV